MAKESPTTLIPVLINKFLLEHRHKVSSMATFILQEQSWTVESEAIGSPEIKKTYILPFIEFVNTFPKAARPQPVLQYFRVLLEDVGNTAQYRKLLRTATG